MKKIITSVVLIVLFSILFAVNANAASSDMEYKTGHQIELYIDSGTSYAISDLAATGFLQIKIEDQSVATVEHDRLVPKSVGFTYISFVYNNYVLHRNIIVHPGYDTVSAVKINHTNFTASGSSLSLKVGEEYGVLINNDEDFELSEAQIILQSPYGDVPVSEFIEITDEGKLKIVGVGKFDLTVKMPTNKGDNGIKVRVDTSFASSAFHTAAKKYLADNGYELTCTDYSEEFMTASELMLVEELTLTSASSLPTSATKRIFPNLKTVTVDLSGSSSTTMGKVTVKNEGFEYRFVGNPSKTYNMQLVFENMSYLNLTFKDFKMTYSGTALNLTKVTNADVFFYGSCGFQSTNASYVAFVGAKVNMVLTNNSNVEIKGANGGASANGGTAVQVTNLSIAGKNFEQSATLNVYGGNGGSATSDGGNGGHGSVGIKATSLTIKGSVSCNITGGSGGAGKSGTDKSGLDRPDRPDRTSSGTDGTTGTKGADGGNGGHGGNGAAAIDVTSLQIVDATKVKCIGGNGGNAGNGGAAQNGGHGGHGGHTSKGTDAGDGGTGGKGGSGGTGGNGGSGARAIKIVNVNDLQACTNLSMTHGYGGNAGSGGAAGDGGNGGNGGDDNNSGGFLGMGEGPVEGDGGTKGSGGTGGAAGTAGSSGSKFNISGVTESVATNPNKKTASKGADGDSGKDGSDGDYGNSK